MDPELPETKASVALTFINEAAPDIKRKFQRVERLREKSLRDLVIVLDKMFNGREAQRRSV